MERTMFINTIDTNRLLYTERQMQFEMQALKEGLSKDEEYEDIFDQCFEKYVEYEF
jgi:hypothetical protein